MRPHTVVDSSSNPFRLRYLALACVAGLACEAEAPQPPPEGPGEVTLAAGCSHARNPDVLFSATRFTAWPGGNIYYEWWSPPPGQTMPRATPLDQRPALVDVMHRWEAASAGRIRFIEDATKPIRIRFIDSRDTAFGTPGAVNFDTCRNTCYVALGPGNADHELSHGVGLKHEMNRNDRDHYMIMSVAPQPNPMPEEFQRSDDSRKTGTGSGPFDFQSVMLYAPTDPDITRWDGSPICAGQSCVTCAIGPTTPYYQPRDSDGSAVIEMYEDRWAMFRPLAKDVGAQQPLSNALASGVTMAGNPAVSSWESGALDVFARGSDGHIYQKSKVLSNGHFAGWSDWSSLGGTNLYDPAAVAWASGRIDVASRNATDVFLKTFSDSAWGAIWSSLGHISGMGMASPPAISSWGSGRLDVFIRGNDDKLYWRRCSTTGTNCAPSSGNWNSWTQIGGNGTFFGTPAAVSRSGGGNRIDVFVHGKDHTLWVISNSGGTWGGFSQVPLGGTLSGTTLPDGTCPSCSSPAASARTSALLDVLIRGNDNRAYLATRSSTGWSGYTVIGGTLSGSPATVTRQRESDRTDLIAFMSDTGSTGETSAWWKEYPNACQRAADFYGIVANQTFGFAPIDVRTWWTANSCDTAANTETPTLCQNASNLFAIQANVSWGGAPQAVQDWWTAHGCNTVAHCDGPPGMQNSCNRKPECQVVSEMFGVAANATFGFAPQEVQDWWKGAGACSTSPITSTSLCQRAAERFAIIGSVTFGYAPQYVRDWWNTQGCDGHF